MAVWYGRAWAHNRLNTFLHRSAAGGLGLTHGSHSPDQFSRRKWKGEKTRKEYIFERAYVELNRGYWAAGNRVEGDNG